MFVSNIQYRRMKKFSEFITVKYPLVGYFEEKQKKWVVLIINMMNKQKIHKYILLAYLMFFNVLATFAQTTPIDLSLRTEIDNATPLLNNNIKYTLWLINKGTNIAANIVVKDVFPIGGANLLTHTGGTNFTFNTNTGEGNWSIANLAANDSVKLEITAQVIQRGVYFNVAEIFSMASGLQDIDSTPNNLKLSEDDLAAVCFSVPIYWYQGDEFTVKIPSPFRYGASIQWLRNGVPITPATPQAVVNADTSLTIKGIGNYSFTSNVAICPATGCCAIQIIQGPLGNIGDWVWKDTNNDGIQNTNETGVSGVIVELYNADAITGLPTGNFIKKDTTDATGKYLFTDLLTGNYVVKILKNTLPASCLLSAKQDVGSDDSEDSDFNSTTGFSDKISINPNDNALRENLSIDAGLYSPLGSIGDWVWKDSNNNGIQDTNEAGARGIILELYAVDGSGNISSTSIQKDTTDVNGYYSFGNLATGNYKIKILTSSIPSDCLLSTKKDMLSDDTKDNDFDGLTGFSPTININPTDATKKDNSTIDAAIYTQVVCPTMTAEQTKTTICMGDSVQIKMTASNGAKINWYLSAVGGSLIKTSNSGEYFKVYPTTTTAYYAEAIGSQTCERTSMVIVVNARPSNPTCVGTVEECEGKTVNLNTYIINTATTPNGKFEWHIGAEPTSALVSTPTAVGAGTYYLFEKSGAGCYSNPTILKVLLKPCDKIIDLSLSKTSNLTNPSVGDNVIFTINVKNEGTEIATNVEIQDILPSNMSFVSSSQFTNKTGTLTANISNIAVGQTITLNYIVRIINASSGTNYAQITKADQKDKDSTPNNGPLVDEDDDDKMTITPKSVEADLSLNKTVSNSTPTQGDAIIYTIEIKNDGPVKATNVEVKDIVPDALGILSTTGGDFVNVANNTVTATFTQINVGETVTLKISVKVKGSGTIKNWAEVTKSDQTESDSTPNNGVDKNEDDDDDAEIIIKSLCNPTTPLISCMSPYICVGESVVLDAVGCNGTVVWVGGQTGTSITVTPTITTIYTAQCKVGDCLSSKSNEITVVVNALQPPSVSASASTICSGASASLTATGCTGTITWSNGQTGTTITVFPTITTEYWAVCSVKTCQSSPSVKKKITIGTSGNAPTISVTKDKVCEGETTTLRASGCDGTVVWSTGQSGVSISSLPTTTTYSAICKIGECSSPKSSEVTVSVIVPQTPTILASKNTICGSELVGLSATGCSGVVTWSNGQVTNVITVTPTTTTTYDAICSNGTCSGKAASKTITVLPKSAAPIVTCGSERICSGETLIFTAHNCEGTVTWSTGAVGSTMSVAPTSTSTYWAVCSVNGCVSDKSKESLITVLSETPIITASNEMACIGTTVTLSASNCSGTLRWNTGATTSSISPVITATTTYTVTCIKETCEKSTSKTITADGTPPTVPKLTSNKTSLCGSQTASLTATGCNGTVKWNDASTGTTKTVSAGSYTALCINICGESTPSSPIIISSGGTIAAPNIVASTTNLCNAGSVSLTATNCSDSVIWSNGQTGSSISVNVSATSTYSAICKADACESPKSNEVTITVGKPAGLSTPKTKNLTNACPLTTVNLVDGITSTVSTTGGVFEFHTGNSPSSTTVPTPSGVGAGTYYVLEKTTTGCYSEASPITVTIAQCNALTADAAITIVGSRTEVKVDEEITYTITVKNNDTKPITNLKIENAIPTGLTITTLPTGLTKEDNVFKATIASLAAGESKTYVYTAKRTSANEIINIAKIISADQTDENTSNNISQYSLSASLATASIGIAKSANTPTKVVGKENTYDVTFTFKVKNFGLEDLTKVQVQDNISTTFGDNVKIDSIKIISDTGFTASTNYTGKGSFINLLDETKSALPKGMTRMVQLFVRVNLSNTTTRTFNNAALAIGTYGNNLTVDDQSVNGDNPDPDNDGLPKNNTSETPIKFEDIVNPLVYTPLGIAKQANLDSKMNSDGSYNITYNIIIKNYGTTKLTNVQVMDTLSKVFTNGVDFVLNGTPTINASSKLKIDKLYNGTTKTNFFIADSSSLGGGVSDTLTFKVIVFSSKQTISFSNIAYAIANDGGKIVMDMSQSGLIPDKDGDNNPGNDNQPTITTIQKLIDPSLVIIPDGFSPNGDTVQDNWLINGINGTDVNSQVSIYNRWGQLVYKNDDFGKEKNGWNGVSNSGGILLGNSTNGVPDGTYYYHLKADGFFDGAIKTGFITLAR
jgi:uncharacterized repeat protein (TIGR01451 family)/gliding motility-associated-like protein